MVVYVTATGVAGRNRNRLAPSSSCATNPARHLHPLPLRYAAGTACVQCGVSGAPHALAVALEWALLEIAIRDKRLFYSIPFSGRDQYDVWVNNLWVKPNPQALADHLFLFYNGGTEPYDPLTKACEIVNQISDDDQRADVLIITDGLFGEPSPELLESVKRARARSVQGGVGVGWH